MSFMVMGAAFATQDMAVDYVVETWLTADGMNDEGESRQIVAAFSDVELLAQMRKDGWLPLRHDVGEPWSEGMTDGEWLEGFARARKHYAETALEYLKEQAEEACCRRDHALGEWDETIHKWRGEPTGRSTAYAECEKCGQGVQVDTKPPPNGIDIGGEAVALDCTEDHHPSCLCERCCGRRRYQES